MFDIEAPIELLLKTCKYKSHDRSSVLALVKLLFIQSKSPPVLDNVKTSRPMLYHQAASIASTDMSLAIDVCKLLNMLKYEINMIDTRTGETALLQECKRLCESEANINSDSSQLELVRTLIQLGASIDFPNEVNGETPLGCAAAYGNLRLLDLLLEAGAQPNVYHKLSFSALHFAVRGGHFACAKALLNAKANISVQLPPRQDETPLFFAIRSKNEELVELLLQNDADPCALCTIHHSLTTSFNIRLSIWSEVKPQITRNEPKKREDAPVNNNLIKAASPLTFALLLAQQWTPFASQEEAIGIDRARERHDWEVFRSMTMILARHTLATTAPSGNTASSLITRQDIDLACRLGFWDLVKILLTYQVTLSSARTVDRMNALHLAAAAGHTDIVTGLVAAGMNVNSVLTRKTLGTNSSRVPTIRTNFHGQQMMNAASIGALHFALVNGHPETAAHLLVLGARPLETMIYYRSARRVRDRANDIWVDREEVIFVVSERMDKKMRDLYFRGKGSQSHDTPVTQSYHRERVAINFVQHLQMSINLRVPILHYMAAMGYTSGVQMLVEAGMNVLQSSRLTNPFNLKIPEWNAESAIHVAILRGHLDVIRYFAMLAQFNFPRYFLRENQKPESLLVVACRTKRADVVRYLLSNGSVNGEGGGYNGRDSPGDIEKAMNTCAAYHFEAGFDMMLTENGCPDLVTLVQVVQSVHWIEKEGAPFVSSVDSETTAMPSLDLKKPIALPLSKRVHLRFCASSHRILLAICRFSQNFDDFFKVLSFDHILKLLIICSQYEQWEVLEKVFVANESRFLNALNPWTPILVRAASCCLVMHRAAAANQVGLIRFFLKLGVPADLQLNELGAVKCPVWYAASRGALDAFVVLALSSTNLTQALTSYCVGGFRVHYRSVSATTSWFSTASTCRWQNLSSMSCYEISKSQRAVYLIQKLINMWIRENRGRLGNSLLHLACETGNLSLIQVLVDAGADILARNTAGSTPLMVAAARQDPFGASVTRYLVGQLRHRGSDEDIASNLGRALVSCFAEPPPCNLKTAKILLAAGADPNYQDGERSALMHALQTLQFAGTKVLVDNGGKLTIALGETFLQRVQSIANDQATRWRRYSSLLKQQGQNLLEVESLLLLFLDKKNGYTVNNDLLLTMLTTSAAIAATVAKASGYDQKFWYIVSNILDQYGSNVAARKSEWNRKSALHFAVQAVEIPIIRKMVDVGKLEVDAEDENKVTPLHLVAYNGDPAACQILLSGLRDQQRVDSVDSKGRTPLHAAITHGHEAVAMQFVAAGASLKIYCHQGWNALVCAARLNHLSILMALYARDSSRELLYSRDGEFAMFIAANHAAFRVVRWFMAMYKDIQSPEASQAIYSVTCKRRLRTLLHYAAIYGDQELINTLLTSEQCPSDIIDQRDAAGYTALMYAFAFGKLAVVETLCRFGARADLLIDHTGDVNAHPYASSFTVGGLSNWFALPGWFAHVSSQFPPTEKRRLTSFVTSEEHYLLGSGYQKRKVRAPIHTDRFRTDLLREYETKKVRTTMKCWQFPRMSLFEYAQDVGDESLISLLIRLGLSSLVQTVSFARRRNGFLQLVRWNRLEIVKVLLESASKSVWAEFVEVGVDCAVSRGLEEMTIYLLSKWQGHKDSSVPADASAFAFQFAHVFQVACIRRLLRLIEYMIERGGEHIVVFHWNEGPALVYAFAFGHADIASRFIAQGAHTSTMDTYRAPSFKKWIEYGCPQEVQVSWYELSAPKEAALREHIATACPPFIGPVEVYEPPHERLDTKAMASLFLPADNGEEEDTRTTPELSTDEVYVTVT
ncbi:hypothetical protein Poli38472_009329 [Pythium oligandrum]|uniref:Ankyrin repeat protein n=1 Tax=Pythium oligandrum TaxID=41045 RepID=A0A8K1FMS6_PYTOL|nr:hypothetical protein Poli38472_009329 [Pythium oligandrum]|eukprot:TMW65162.1 hypothetical protein Poli38472_009329 [Pythium oligandrum]